VALLVACAASLEVQSADAAPPDREHESSTVTDRIDCSSFGQGWDFVDDFVDEFQIDRRYVYNSESTLVRIVEHWQQTSTDTNSITGLTISEHNHFLVEIDLVDMTFSASGAINSAQRRGTGSVIHRAGHKVLELDLSQTPPLGAPLFNGGPLVADDEAFCRALA
jgi:hypothetical protein